MADYISKNELLSAAAGYDWVAGLRTVLARLPAADVRKNKRGKWEELPTTFVWNADGIYRAAYKCSNCEHILPFMGDFCPNCGCAMEVDK